MLNSGRIHFPRSTSFIPNFIFNVHHGPVFSILKLRSLKGMKIVVTGQAGNLSVCHSMASERPWLNPVRFWSLPSKQGLWTKTPHTGSWLRKKTCVKNMSQRNLGFFVEHWPPVVIGPRIPWRWWLIAWGGLNDVHLVVCFNGVLVGVKNASLQINLRLSG